MPTDENQITRATLTRAELLEFEERFDNAFPGLCRVLGWHVPADCNHRNAARQARAPDAWRLDSTPVQPSAAALVRLICASEENMELARRIANGEIDWNDLP